MANTRNINGAKSLRRASICGMQIALDYNKIHSVQKGGRSSMKFKPLGARVLAKRVEELEEQKSSGGIIIPDTAKEKPQRGTIIAVGTGRIKDDGTRIPLDVKEGDEVLFGKYAGKEVKIDGVEYLILDDEEILGIIQK
jgi:chaperonin GroES